MERPGHQNQFIRYENQAKLEINKSFKVIDKLENTEIENPATVEECEDAGDIHLVSVYKYNSTRHSLSKILKFSTQKPVQITKSVRETVKPRVVFTGYDKSVFWVIQNE